MNMWCKWPVESELVHTFLACTNVYLVLKWFVLHKEKSVKYKLCILILRKLVTVS
jgi:plastocyanin domain-containing protein